MVTGGRGFVCRDASFGRRGSVDGRRVDLVRRLFVFGFRLWTEVEDRGGSGDGLASAHVVGGGVVKRGRRRIARLLAMKALRVFVFFLVLLVLDCKITVVLLSVRPNVRPLSSSLPILLQRLQIDAERWSGSRVVFESGAKNRRDCRGIERVRDGVIIVGMGGRD